MKKNKEKNPQNNPAVESTVDKQVQDEIQRRAYELWEAAGRPSDGDLAHWLEAELQIKAQRGVK